MTNGTKTLAAPMIRPASVNSSRRGPPPQAERDQGLRDDAVAPEHDLPGEGLDHHPDRERQDDRDQDQRLSGAARPGQRQGGREADGEREQRDQDGDAQRVADHDPVERIGEEFDEAGDSIGTPSITSARASRLRSGSP